MVSMPSWLRGWHTPDEGVELAQGFSKNVYQHSTIYYWVTPWWAAMLTVEHLPATNVSLAVHTQGACGHWGPSGPCRQCYRPPKRQI